LIRHGFVKDYTVWKYHGEEADPSAIGASGGNSSTVNEGGQQSSSSTAAASGDSAKRDYININDLLENIAADNDDGEDGEHGDVVLGPEDVEIFENVANHMDQDDVLFGNPKWLKNFKEMKQATIDPLYNGCLKHWTMLRFNLQMLIKASHRCRSERRWDESVQ
jgi:hypothetical protein